MKQYIGTKIINAKPMTLGGYNNFRGWEIPKDEDPAREGYLVEYTDGGEPNTAEYKGYVSWSPKEVFERAYRLNGNLTFGDALVYLKDGKKLARRGWNGKGMFIFLVPGSTFKVNRSPLLGIYPEGTEVQYHAHIDMKTAQGYIVPWLASQADMLAEDWEVVE
ncbi:DUF2829 domain-containing protein [Nitratifractor salsuginis]|uniref:Thoeris anti-defense 2-like domain-containing protein n=1 Tax=Nitratifractor salsuginis (strain DSM 16511 / JCM 12458 / E9I37-1) TaxID=749222 RepID=E6WYD5_NITSE|nr:DUF2829 domain-containing protein [Nitratifractor salsuginis]ADV46447.1 hypothetical protein Nitsa_1194 [Nitratifractor salsuginis DSM 16511]